MLAASFMLCVLMAPSRMLAKVPTSRITIQGGGLNAPIEITDANVLGRFFVWADGGTSPNQASAFIIDGSRGPAAERPKGLRRYEVSFYAKLPEERLIYVVQYELDPSTGKGYVHLPGRGEKWYRLNVSTILRGVEGNWFHAWEVWDKAVRPLIDEASTNRASGSRDCSSH
ncbi:MAG TPA: hypothetical protein VLE48_01825 [Terriglobales bacterium]|nr:hypothetical protein [Terriglobales bacterium]